MLLVSICDADEVATVDGCHSGRLKVTDGRLKLDDRPIPFKSVLTLSTDNPATVGGPEVIHTRDGQRWVGRILGIGPKSLILHAEPFGRVEAALSHVGAIVFHSGHGRDLKRRNGTLYRRDGRPLTGRLDRLAGTVLQITSALGVLELEKAEVLEYVYAVSQNQPGAPLQDEVHLINGAVYRGQVGLEADRVRIDHPILGEASMPLTAVACILRNPAGVMRISPQVWQVLPATGPIGPVPPPELVDSASDRRPAFVLHAGSTIRVPLPAQCVGKQCTFRAWIASTPDSRAAGILRDPQRAQRLVADGTEIFWSSQFVAGDVFELRYDFADKVRLPCKITLRDPVVAWD